MNIEQIKELEKDTDFNGVYGPWDLDHPFFSIDKITDESITITHGKHIEYCPEDVTTETIKNDDERLLGSRFKLYAQLYRAC